MSNDFYDFGELISELSTEALKSPAARAVLGVCFKHADFKPVELRYLSLEGRETAEMVVVDCSNDSIPTKNQIGIHYPERLGLVFFVDRDRLPEVRALRKDFPATPHQNHVPKGEPASLCLYFEPWEVVERTWTPQSHLNRIVWWLVETAHGTLHRDDQPLEQLYFRSEYEIVLPPNFNETVQKNELVLSLERITEKVFQGKFVTLAEVNTTAAPVFSCIALSLPPIIHGVVEQFPYDLGTLNDQLASRGVRLLELLSKEIWRITSCSGIQKNQGGVTLLVLRMPIQRKAGSRAERIEHKAFCIQGDLGRLGEACGVLSSDGPDGKYYRIQLIGETMEAQDAWRQLRMEPVDAVRSLTLSMARDFSGIQTETAEFAGVLAGVGALGSNLAELWYREAWGSWTFVDLDRIEPHNLARHIANDSYIGRPKAEAVKDLVATTYFSGYIQPSSIVDSATNWSNVSLMATYEAADLVIDATTSLAVPRELSKVNLKRAASVFLTPSGLGAVLLLEDSLRNIRLDSLEAQYYRAILNNLWGEEHLKGHQGHLWVGAGCRDISMIMSTELVQLHSATLARQLRLKKEHEQAMIGVWHVEPDAGGIIADSVSVADPLTVEANDWHIAWDNWLHGKVHQLRKAAFPNETGGVLLGYIDQKVRTIYVVDVLPAPPDSEAESDGFTRGSQGLQEMLKSVQTKTANIVSYLGEWHSHPRGMSASPSMLDVELLAYLAKMLEYNGLPALMLIVGEAEETWSIGETT
jgi:integrative and conjugative element protein (TIGR02256 family)